MSLPKFTCGTLDKAQRGADTSLDGSGRSCNVLCDLWEDGTAHEALRLAGIPELFDAYHLVKAYWDEAINEDSLVLGLEWVDVKRAVCLMLPAGVASEICGTEVSRGHVLWEEWPPMDRPSVREWVLEILRKASGRKR